MKKTQAHRGGAATRYAPQPPVARAGERGSYPGLCYGVHGNPGGPEGPGGLWAVRLFEFQQIPPTPVLILISICHACILGAQA
jgi:hypothetical protein